jgi:nickel/cobalt transporter (NicO) family protein
MNHFLALLQQGHTWLLMPSALFLGALHGLEPGHSKTMMAAFIIAIRGTVPQAALLGLAATLSHTAIVWVVALGGMYFGKQWYGAGSEPYLQLISAVLIIGVALWMLWRTRAQAHRGRVFFAPEHRHPHGHDHGHRGDDADVPAADREASALAARQLINTGHGSVRLTIEERGGVGRFRLQCAQGGTWPGEVQVETERADGSREVFTFQRGEQFLESVQQIPAPHEFVARLRLGHAGHHHRYDVEFVAPAQRHALSAYAPLDLTAPGYEDPHELAHANDIRRRFASGEVTSGQIVLFGLTGGLIPCPASVTVLLLCLQLREVMLGVWLVLCFSIGLAVTLVATGVIAALGVRWAQRHTGFGVLARRAPYAAGVVILLVGFYVGLQGLRAFS